MSKKSKEETVQLSTTKIEYVPVDSIKPNAYNPNRQSGHEFELLCRSMREDGFTTPIVAMKESREIVDGEHRWKAAQAIGIAEVPVVFVNMTEAQMKVSTLRHNRARGSEDVQAMAAVLRELNQSGAIEWAADSLMIEDVELERILEDYAPQDDSELNAILGGRTGDMSPEQTAHVRQAQAEREKARKEEDHAASRKDQDIYRLVLVFEKEEAELIKKVLGDQPAPKILELCRKRQGGAA